MYNIFSSYLHEKIFTLDTDKIKKDIFNNKSKNKGVVMSNHGGWQSKGNPTKIIKNKNIKSLFNKITMSVKEIEKKLNLKKELFLSNYWYNVNYLGSFNRPHSHPGAVISGVYYVDVPKNSGNIVFQQLGLEVENTYRDNVDIYNQYNSSVWTIVPKKNLCVLFPSYLDHYVEPNLNKKERISISFNYDIQK